MEKSYTIPRFPAYTLVDNEKEREEPGKVDDGKGRVTKEIKEERDEKEVLAQGEKEKEALPQGQEEERKREGGWRAAEKREKRVMHCKIIIFGSETSQLASLLRKYTDATSAKKGFSLFLSLTALSHSVPTG